MTAVPVPAFQRLQHDSRMYLDIGLLIAAGLHLLGFLVTFSYEPRPYSVETKKFEVVPIVDEVTIPLPPVDIPRPPIPLADVFTDIRVADDADMEETIEDRDVDIANPTAPRLDYDRAVGGDAGEWTTFSRLPEVKKLYRPEYPSLARSVGIEGTVLARVYIDASGRPVRVEIIQSPAEVLNRPVIEALMKSEFYPAQQRDIPVKSRMLVPVEFKLR